MHRQTGNTGPRIARERRTVRAMIEIFCRGHHGRQPSLCPQCQELWDYASRRLAFCRFGEDKPTCAQCPIHCYKQAMRDQIKAVMRYAGPRMLWRHPLLALLHSWDGWRSRRRSAAVQPPHP